MQCNHRVRSILVRVCRLVKLQRRIYTINMLLGRFANTQWEITNKKFAGLNERLSESDRLGFHMERCVDPYEYFRASILACRPLLLKEDNATIPKAKAQQYR